MQRPDDKASLSDIDRFFGCGTYVWHVPENRVIWSDGMLDLFGVTQAPAAEESINALVHPDDRMRVDAEVLGFLEAGDRYSHEFRIIHRDGDIRYIHGRGEIERDTDGKARVLRGLNIDVTDARRRPSEPVSDSLKDPFRQVIARAPWRICLFDSDLRLVHLSESAAAMFRSTSPLIGRDCADLLSLLWPEPVASILIAHIRQTLATGTARTAPVVAALHGERMQTDVEEVMLEQIRLPDGRAGVACYFCGPTRRSRQENLLRESEERLQLAYEVSGMSAWDLNLTTGNAVWTLPLYDLLGLEHGSPGSADLFFEFVHPEDKEDLRTALDTSIATGEILETRFRIRRGDGALRHIVARGRVVDHEAGVPVRMIGITYDVTDRYRMEREIEENEKRLRLILDNAVAFIGLLHPDGTLVEANATALAAGGLAREDVIGKKFWETQWWSHDVEMAASLRAAVGRVSAGEAVRYDAVVRMQGNTRMVIDLLLSPIIDDDGRVHRIVASAFDITKREEALKSVQLLMGEINHRSKNTLALVQAIARQIWRASPENFFDRFTSRLQALASSQDLLVNQGVDGAYLKDIARSQLAHFGELIGKRIHLDGPPIGVNADAAQAIGMAFHELATNAGKYGALATHQGQIFVSWEQRGDQMALSWVEVGGPPVTRPTRTGFGSVMLDTIVRGTLSGDVVIDFDEQGLRWSLTCPNRYVLP